MKTTKPRNRHHAKWTATTPDALAALADLVFVDELPPPAERKLIRELAGLTLDDVATALLTDRGTLSRWESGARKPSGPSKALYGLTLQRLASIPLVREALTLAKATLSDPSGDGSEQAST